MKNLLAPLCLLFACLTLPASAVIVAGASGGGNTSNNTTAAQFQSEYGLELSIYDNVISYSGASGIYLGYNEANKDIWFITAKHVNSSPTVTIDGLTYNRKATGGDLLPGGDLRLVGYNREDLAVPTLPAIPISTTVPALGTSLVMIGFGRNRTQNATTDASTSDAVDFAVGTGYNWSGTNLKRWGTNQIESGLGTYMLLGAPTIAYTTIFDEPGSEEWLDSNEAQGSAGDSGGGAFYYSGGQWVLSGIFSAVGGFEGQPANTAAFGNQSLLTDIFSYSTSINTLLGGITLVPEPSASVLILFASTAMLSRRRRA